MGEGKQREAISRLQGGELYMSIILRAYSISDEGYDSERYRGARGGDSEDC